MEEFNKIADENIRKYPLRGLCGRKKLEVHQGLIFLDKKDDKYWYGCINCKDIFQIKEKLPIV